MSEPHFIVNETALRAEIAALDERLALTEQARIDADRRFSESAMDLSKANAEIERLKAEDARSTEYLREVLRKVDEEQKGLAVCSWCALPTNSDTESKRAHQLTCAQSPLVAEIELLREKAALLDAPEIHDFAKAVVLEAAHQRARWPSDHDTGKTDADWFWLIGYLAGKALHNPPDDRGTPAENQRLHRIITVAAAAANWHAAQLGQTNMRPGIETPPEGDS